MKSELKIPETVIKYDLSREKVDQALYCDTKRLWAKLLDSFWDDNNKNVIDALVNMIEQGTITLQDIFFMAACAYSEGIEQMMGEIQDDQRRARPTTE